MQVDSTQPKKVLAIYAHPNDADLACGGILATWASAGAQVNLFVASMGDKGSNHGVDGDLSTHRRDEVEAASKVLGLAGVEVLGLPDGEFENDLDLRSVLVARIRQLQPEIVITHDPTAMLFGDVYVNHRDHRVVGQAVLDVVQAAAPNPRYFASEMHPHAVSQVWLSATEQPNVAVDISGSLKAKISAMREHHSQVENAEGIDELVTARAAADGRDSHLKAAEVFRRLFLT